MTEKTYAGGCGCGQLRYVAHGEPIDVRVCHCSLCQAANGGKALPRAVFYATEVEIVGETTSYASSNRTNRFQCARCGEGVFGKTTYQPPRCAVALHTLDEQGVLKPDMRFWVSDDPEAAELNDGLPQYPEYPPDYAARIAAAVAKMEAEKAAKGG
jgi:hypothetical protein